MKEHEYKPCIVFIHMKFWVGFFIVAVDGSFTLGEVWLIVSRSLSKCYLYFI